MYTHIIGVDDELWDILEDGIDIPVDRIRMVADRKSLTPAQNKTYRKHHKMCGILVDDLPYSKYLKITTILLQRLFLNPWLLHMKAINR